jgi:Endonuclease/Exonuclease/phosphatase family
MPTTLRSRAVVLVCAASFMGATPVWAQPAATKDADAKAAPSPIRLGAAAPKPKTPGTIRVATYNLENLFDHVDDPGLTGSMEDMDLAATPQRCGALAKAILATQADIIACEEVESLEALTWFRDTYLKGAGFDHVASIQSGDPRGIEQAVLSKFAFKSAQLAIPLDQLRLEGVHPESLPASDKGKVGKPITMARSPLRVEFVIPAEKVSALMAEAEAAKAASAKGPKKPAKVFAGKDYAFTMLVIHHKSGREYAHQREAEAKKILSIVQGIEKEHPSANVLLAGDFNSLPQYEGPQVYFTGGLIDLFADRKRGDTTMMTHATDRAIDYLVVNKNMQAEVVMESRFILGTPLRPAKSDWNTTPAPAGYASDHLPVVVDIRPTE